MFVNDSIQLCNTYFESEHNVYAKYKFILDTASYLTSTECFNSSCIKTVVSTHDKLQISQYG